MVVRAQKIQPSATLEKYFYAKPVSFLGRTMRLLNFLRLERHHQWAFAVVLFGAGDEDE